MAWPAAHVGVSWARKFGKSYYISTPYTVLFFVAHVVGYHAWLVIITYHTIINQ